MITALVRLYGRMRTDLIRSRIFDRKVRVRTGRLPNLTPTEQACYDRACASLEKYRPVRGANT